MDSALPPLLSRTRSRLNAVILAHRALAWAAPAAVAAGLAIGALRAVGVQAAGLLPWALLVAAGAAGGAAAARRSRVDAAGAARWLDERLADGEALSAALVCVGRGASEPFDAEIVRKADEMLEAAAALRPPPGALAKRAAIAVAACAIGAYIVLLAAPASVDGAGPRSRAAAAAASVAEGGAAAALSSLADGGSAAASTFARSLFPDDKRLATLAERALREGRIDDLADMLKAADLEYDSKLSRAVGETERRKLASERERIQDAARALAARYQEGSGGNGESGGEGEDGNDTRGDPFLGDPYSGDRGLSGSGGAGSDGRNGAPSYGERAKELGKTGGELGAGSSEGSSGAGGQFGKGGPGKDGSGLGGAGSGFGSGSGEEGAWGPIAPSASPKRAVIEPSKDVPFFELVLPGQGASSPIAELVPDSRRSAESAMAREAIPLEYEDFIRSYFLELSKGESR